MSWLLALYLGWMLALTGALAWVDYGLRRSMRQPALAPVRRQR